MKWFLFAALFIICSCRSNSVFSPEQKGLLDLSEKFKTEYKDTSDSKGRRELIGQYEIKLQDYLKHSCAFILDTVKVHVQKIELDPKGKLLAEFTDENCTYTVRRNYTTANQMKSDSIFQLVSQLRENENVTLRLLFDGNIKVNEFENASTKPFNIEVTPTEIKKV